MPCKKKHRLSQTIRYVRIKEFSPIDPSMKLLSFHSQQIASFTGFVVPHKHDRILEQQQQQ